MDMARGELGADWTGLSEEEAKERLAKVGPNDTRSGKPSPLAQLLPLLGNPLAVVLLVAAGLSAALGQKVDAALIAVMVLFSVGVNLVQTWRSQKAAERLRAQVALTASVLRDGVWAERPRDVIVPGDIVRVSAGDLVPADARILEARDLHAQEAAMTGESLPAEKGPARSESDPQGMLWLGTSIVSGTGVARVVATGRGTQFGDVIAHLQARPPETEYERGLRQFGMLITRTVLVLVLVIVAASLAMHRPAFESLLFAVALAVGLTPEFLPMITTVTLSQGATQMARAHVIVKRLSAIQDLGSMDVLCSDKTGTLTRGEMHVDGSFDPAGRPADRALALARVNSRFETGIRSPLDAAILADAPPGGENGWTKLDEIPFDFERRRLSIAARGPQGALLITKGAPESVCAICEGDEAARAAWRTWAAEVGKRGLRVLAVATKPLDDHRSSWSRDDETGLTLEGFVTFSDPPLPEAQEVLARLRRDGVALKIVSGDDPAVAAHVCQVLGVPSGEIVLGSDIERMTDGALARVAERASIFARTSPAQKTRILLALKKSGHVVGFMGDGINDAPSLHAADVGISVAGAADVAREAADILLTRAGLDVLHGGILAGRRAFANVTKYLLMGTSSNFGNMVSMAASSLILPFLPMLPTQILLNNLLYDVSQIAIPTDRVDEAWIEKPRRSDIGLVRRFMLLVGPISSAFDFLTFYVLIRVFHAHEALFHTGWFVESLFTQTLVLFVIRTYDWPWKSRPSVPLAASVIGVALLGLALPATPLAGLLGFVPLPPSYFIFLVAATVGYLGLVEMAKRRLVHGGTFSLDRPSREPTTA
jgi:Mg2+-importing ATPase